MTAVTIEQPLVLVVEGGDDKNFFEASARCLGLAHVKVLLAGGKQNLRPYIKAISNAPDFRSKAIAFGVVRDADTDPTAAFQSVRDALLEARLPAPEAPLQVAEGNPAVSVMILPGAGQPGKIEDLCLASVSADPATPCIEAYFECLLASGASQPSDFSKAKVQAFLASRPKPCPHLGIAAQQGHWPWNAHAFQDTRKFLEDLATRIGS
jgi:hypothetical protein